MKKCILRGPCQMEIIDVPIPEPAWGEVRIKITNIGICGSDPTIYKGLHPYVSYPVTPGHELSGLIDAVGPGVSAERIGQRVTVIPHKVCGYCDACKNKLYNFCEELKCTGAEADGGMCEYFCIDSEMAMEIPETMSLEQAAMVEPASVGYHGAARAGISGKDRVLIIGAGPIGIFCMQSVKAMGAKEIYIANRSAGRLRLAAAFEPDGMIETGRESLAEGLARYGRTPKNIDVFYDCVGEKGAVLNEILTIARRGTRIVEVGVLQNCYEIPRLPDFVQHELTLFGTTMYTPYDYREVIRLIGEGKIRTDGLVSHRFAFKDIPEILESISNKQLSEFKIMIDMSL